MSTAPPAAAPAPAGAALENDRRGSWVPSGAMIATRIMELRRRKGLMAALIVVNIGIPSVFLAVRLVAHAVAPSTYGPAGGYDVFTGLVAGVLFVFGFIVAATLGCAAGSTDLTDGMFRHLVITGRSRLALYFARIPAGLAIVVPMVAAGFAVVCAVCVFAAPTTLDYQGVSVPANLSAPAFQTWAANHPEQVVCGFPYTSSGPVQIPCFLNGKGQVVFPKRNVAGLANASPTSISRATWRADARKIAAENYPAYSERFLYPSVTLMVESGLWVELAAVVAFVVGLGLASLMGQRTVPVVLMIILEVILTPLFSRTPIPHLINAQRGLVGLAMAHVEPSALPAVFAGGGSGPGAPALVPESTTVAVVVIVAWLVVWTALGAWRIARRDA